MGNLGAFPQTACCFSAISLLKATRPDDVAAPEALTMRSSREWRGKAASAKLRRLDLPHHWRPPSCFAPTSVIRTSATARPLLKGAGRGHRNPPLVPNAITDTQTKSKWLPCRNGSGYTRSGRIEVHTLRVSPPSLAKRKGEGGQGGEHTHSPLLFGATGQHGQHSHFAPRAPNAPLHYLDATKQFNKRERHV